MPDNDIIKLEQTDELPEFQGGSWDEYVSTWFALQESVQQHLWMLSAIAASLTTRYGESDVKRFAYEVRLSTSRIYQLARTYKAFQNRRRSSILSFHHHTIAAKADDPEALIEEAEVDNLSTRQLESRCKQLKGEENPTDDQGEAEAANGEELGHDSPWGLEHWYGHIKAQPCLKCGTTERVEAAHIEAFPSRQHSGMMPRRKGVSVWACIPLCTECHREAPDSIHNIGEFAFMAQLRSPSWVFGWLARELAEFFAGGAYEQEKA